MPGFNKDEEQCRKLFIGGISYDTTDENMREYFAQYGTITDCVVIKESDSGKSKGFGFVTYEEEKEADKCMDARPHNLHGRNIDVKRAVSREESMKPGAHVQVKKIFIGGLREDLNHDDLKGYFAKFGTITDFAVPVDKEKKRPRGFAFVTFDDFDAVDKLVAKRHHDICGCRCEVKKALSKEEMEKAKLQVEQKQQRFAGVGRGGGSRGGGRAGAMGGYGGGYSDCYGGAYGGGYDDSYEAAYNVYGAGGPMRAAGRIRAGGPYGGGYSSGGAYGGYSGGGYGDDGYTAMSYAGALTPIPSGYADDVYGGYGAAHPGYGTYGAAKTGRGYGGYN